MVTERPGGSLHFQVYPNASLAKVYAAAGIEVTPMSNAAVDGWEEVARSSTWKSYGEKTKLAGQMLAMAGKVPA